MGLGQSPKGARCQVLLQHCPVLQPQFSVSDNNMQTEVLMLCLQFHFSLFYFLNLLLFIFWLSLSLWRGNATCRPICPASVDGRPGVTGPSACFYFFILFYFNFMYFIFILFFIFYFYTLLYLYLLFQRLQGENIILFLQISSLILFVFLLHCVVVTYLYLGLTCSICFVFIRNIRGENEINIIFAKTHTRC